MQDEASLSRISSVDGPLSESVRSAIAKELLRSRASTDRPECGSGRSGKGYDTPLHVFALFLILFLSTLACSFPIVAKKFPRLPIPHRALFLSRHFGTGVLIATAFVHLLPTAYTSLTDPCLPPFWTQGYPAMAGFIAMVSMMVVVGVEMFFATKGAGHSHSSEYSSVAQGASDGAASRGGKNGNTRPAHNRMESMRRFKQAPIGKHGESSEDLVSRQENEWSEDANDHDVPMVSQKRRPTQGEEDDSDLDLDELDPQGDESRYTDDAADDREAHTRLESQMNTTSPLSEHQQQQKALLQCLLLEAGILFHSVFIGMAVSVATGTAFVVLLIAISFHQTFEGLALGSRIAAISAFPKGSPKPWFMALAYGTTTPVGQAIGLLVHNLYDPYSQMGLLMVGVMNAISSGLLLFAGLVELLAEDFLSDHSYETLKGARRLEACAAVVAGSMLMALVGAWA